MAAVVDVLIKGKYEAGKAFDSLQAALKTASDGTGKTIGKFQEWTAGFADLKAGFDVLAGVAGTAMQAVQQAYAETITKTADYAKEVRDLSRTIGASAEESSKLIQAADDMGISYQTLTSAMEGAIRKGADPSIAGIAKLAEQYNAIQNPIEKTAFLMDTFGKAGADLGPLMEQGAAGIRAMGEEAKKAGLVLDEKAVQAARNYEIALDNLTDKVDAQRIKWGNEWIPTVTDVIDLTIRANEATEEHGTSWLAIVPAFAAVEKAVNAVGAAIEMNAEKANKASGEIATAQAQLNSFNAAAAGMPVVGHGTSYKAGQGPAYPYSDKNPTGYVLDSMGNRTYPGRAAGGPVVAGVTYMVGENGPEPFTPSTNGYIGPSGSGGGGGGGDINLTVQVNSLVGIQDQAEAERILFPVVENIQRKLRRNGQ